MTIAADAIHERQVLAVAHSANHSISRRRQWRLEEVHDAVVHDPPASLNVVRQAAAEGKRKTRRRFRERKRYVTNHAEKILAVYVCLNTIKATPGISALSDMFNIYNADQSIKIGLTPFSNIKFNGHNYNIDTVVYCTDSPLNTTIVNMTRFMNDHMRAGVVLSIREFECREDSVYVELAVEHAAFADVILVIDAEKQ